MPAFAKPARFAGTPPGRCGGNSPHPHFLRPLRGQSRNARPGPSIDQAGASPTLPLRAPLCCPAVCALIDRPSAEVHVRRLRVFERERANYSPANSDEEPRRNNLTVTSEHLWCLPPGGVRGGDPQTRPTRAGSLPVRRGHAHRPAERSRRSSALPGGEGVASRLGFLAPRRCDDTSMMLPMPSSSTLHAPLGLITGRSTHRS